MNYYSFHIGDFRAGTVNMSRQARWIYRDMLDIYYDTETPLALDFERLCDDLGIVEEADQAIVKRLLKFKFNETAEGFTHDVCDRVIQEFRVKVTTAKANGKLGGRPSKPKETQSVMSGIASGSDSVPTQNLIETLSQTNQEPLTINQEPVVATKRRTQLPEGFSPNETGRAKAVEKGLVVETELAKFSDYHRAKGSVMLDWQAAWRTWIGNAKPVAADIARQTVPSRPGRDPALIKAEEDTRRAAPIPPQLRETIAKLTGRMAA